MFDLVWIYDTNVTTNNLEGSIWKPTPGPLGALPKNFDDNEDEVTYADADYKDIYEFGPVSYKNASKEAAAKKKAEMANRKQNFYTPAPKPTKQD